MLEIEGVIIPVINNFYFSVSGNFKLSGSGLAIVIEAINDKFYSGFMERFLLGSIEEVGRLKYIDGCSDSLLLSPAKLGYPCLNHLHFPKNIIQTMHTHPTHRMGVISSGHGECVTPFGSTLLNNGDIFIIKEGDNTKSIGLDGKLYLNGSHKFNTFDSVMNVIAFHPDSDFGPTDQSHPMINRTFVDGVSASLIDNIRTV
jgi:hypothetical protein